VADSSVRIFNREVQKFHAGLRVTALVALPATILIAAVLGTWTQRELLFTVVFAVVFAGIALPISHAMDRQRLGYVRDRMDDRSGLQFEVAVAKLTWFKNQAVINFLLAYIIGGLIVTVAGNAAAGLPLWNNAAAILISGFCGGLVDASLNYFNAEALVAQLVAVLSAQRRQFLPVPASARGGIERRFLIALSVAIAITLVAMGGSLFHLLIDIKAGTTKPDDAMRIGAIYTGCSLVVSFLIAFMASRILSRTISRPILHTVELMDRLRIGDVLQEGELQSEPRFLHEAGLLVEAFADTNMGLSRLANSGERLANGDLSVRIVPQSERDVVAMAFRKVVEAIRIVVGDVRTTAELLEESATALARRADQFVADARSNAGDLTQAAGTMATLDTTIASIASGAHDLSNMAVRARETAERLGAAAQTNAAGLEQLAQTAKATIEAAKEVFDISGSAGDSADAASAAIVQADRTSEEAAGVMQELVAAIGSLRDSSQQIGSITDRIDQIADQTNLLALNAAIEAARAGDHGRGFAVVADEIRKLADSSATATKEIAQLIHLVQDETNRAVTITRRGSEAVEVGRAKTTQVADALSLIVDSVSAVRARIDVVVMAQREQKTATDSLIESTLLVERLTGENTELSNSLYTLAETLSDSSDSGATAMRSSSGGVAAVAARGGRIASASDELVELTTSLRNEADRIRKAISGFSENGGADKLPTATPARGGKPERALPR
jgi:methyl-accepting chemotaxis protein